MGIFRSTLKIKKSILLGARFKTSKIDDVAVSACLFMLAISISVQFSNNPPESGSGHLFAQVAFFVFFSLFYMHLSDDEGYLTDRRTRILIMRACARVFLEFKEKLDELGYRILIKAPLSLVVAIFHLIEAFAKAKLYFSDFKRFLQDKREEHALIISMLQSFLMKRAANVYKLLQRIQRGMKFLFILAKNFLQNKR